MKLKQAIYNRRSVRIFQDKKVEAKKISQIIDAAQWAPSACNKQGWRFIAVSDKKIKEAIIRKAGSTYLIKKAPLVIFVLYQKHLTERKYSHVQSAAAAIQNLLLMAYSLGLGATWSTGLGKIEEIKKELKIPDNFQVIACVVLGYSREQPMTPQRKKIEEILSFDYFDFADSSYPFSYDIKKWSLKQIIRFREDSICATSPVENSYTFGRAKELEKEVGFISRGLSENEKILEIMPFAGTHTLSILRTKKFKNYHIFELSKQPIGFIKKRLLFNNFESIFESSVGHPVNLPYSNNSFDAVIIFQKLEMLPDLRILDEIFRILKPGGKFFFSFKNMTGLYGLYYWYKFRFFKQGQIWNYGPFVPLNYFKIRKILKEKFILKQEIGITPLFLINKTIFYPLSFLGRLVVFNTISKKK